MTWGIGGRGGYRWYPQSSAGTAMVFVRSTVSKENPVKTGRTLEKLEAELQRQREAKVDYLEDTARMALRVGDPPKSGTQFGRTASSPPVRLWLEGRGGFGLTWYSRQQLAERVGIPPRYFDRMWASAPSLLAENVNHWLKAQPRRKVLVRTMDGTAQALLSDRYRPLDNFDVAGTVLPALKEAEAELVSCELTETHLYLKAVVADLKVELWPEGVEQKWGRGNHPVHVLQAGLVVSNSEIGTGALSINMAIHTEHCSNLAVVKRHGALLGWRKRHVGRRLAGGIGTRGKSDAAVWAHLRNLVHQSLQGEGFREIVKVVKASLSRKISHPAEAVEFLATAHRFTKEERECCLGHLVDGGDLSQYGLHQAVSRMAQDVRSYDRASQLEQLSGTIVQLEGEDWEKIAFAGR